MFGQLHRMTHIWLEIKMMQCFLTQWELYPLFFQEDSWVSFLPTCPGDQNHQHQSHGLCLPNKIWLSNQSINFWRSDDQEEHPATDIEVSKVDQRNYTPRKGDPMVSTGPRHNEHPSKFLAISRWIRSLVFSLFFYPSHRKHFTFKGTGALQRDGANGTLLEIGNWVCEMVQRELSLKLESDGATEGFIRFQSPNNFIIFIAKGDRLLQGE